MWEKQCFATIYLHSYITEYVCVFHSIASISYLLPLVAYVKSVSTSSSNTSPHIFKMAKYEKTQNWQIELIA